MVVRQTHNLKSLGPNPRGYIMKMKKLKEYLRKKYIEYHDELKTMDMDDVAFLFLLGQKSGMEEALYFIEHGKDIFEG